MLTKVDFCVSGEFPLAREKEGNERPELSGAGTCPSTVSLVLTPPLNFLYDYRPEAWLIPLHTDRTSRTLVVCEQSR